MAKQRSLSISRLGLASAVASAVACAVACAPADTDPPRGAPAAPTASQAAHLPSIGKARPVDEAARDPQFAAFRDSLLGILARRDTTALLAIIAPEIKSSFGGDYGLAGFREHWQFDAPESKLWSVLEDVLRHGGRFSGEEYFWAPWTFHVLPDSIDPFEHQLIRDSAVVVRAAADPTGAVLGLLSYDIVRARECDPDAPSCEILLADGRRGYVPTAQIRSPVDYRAGFERRAGRWWLVILVAGD